MQIFFQNRNQQRAFSCAGKKVDNGSTAKNGRRWGVELTAVVRRVS